MNPGLQEATDIEEGQMARIKRRDFLRMMAWGGLASAVPGVSTASNSRATRPNIILFITDDQDKHSIGAYGGNVLTPNLDRLAREGIIFHQAYVSHTVCTPSRYSFLTGRYAGRSYSKMYHSEYPPGKQGFPSFNMELEDDNMNVGAVLSKSGYAAGYVGKFHVGPEIKGPQEHEERGLKYVSPDSPPNEAASEAFRHNERWFRQYLLSRGFSWAKHIYWGNLQKPFAHHNPEWTIEAALQFIEENKDRPFYLHYCTTLVHGPDKSWHTSMNHPKVSGEGLLDDPPDVMTDRQALLKQLEAKGLDPAEGHAGYTWVDDSVGAIMKKLDKLKIADNTLIVFIGDHGSKMKGSLFNVDGINVPCIMRWPKGIKGRTECHELVQNIDFVPTFFDLAGVRVPGKYAIDGRSLRPLFDASTPKQWRDHLYFEMGCARAVCTKEWKYIAVRYTKEQIEQIKNSRPEQLPKLMSYISRSGIGTRGAANPNFFDSDQLYNVKLDPQEKKNLADRPAHRRRLEEMRGMLTEDLKSFNRPFGEFVPGGNASPPGLVDDQIALVKRIKIQGKTVILPDGQTVDEKAPNTRRTERQKQRAEKREARTRS